MQCGTCTLFNMNKAGDEFSVMTGYSDMYREVINCTGPELVLNVNLKGTILFCKAILY